MTFGLARRSVATGAGAAPRFHDLRHTFGTRMAAAGVPMRTLQEWLGHRDFATTLIYADYQPSAREADLVDEAFRTEASYTPLSEVACPARRHERPCPDRGGALARSYGRLAVRKRRASRPRSARASGSRVAANTAGSIPGH